MANALYVCLTTPAARRWDLPDPKGQPVETVRAIRDEIEQRVAGLVEELDRG